MNITENYPKCALSGRKEIHPCVLQDIGPLGPPALLSLHFFSLSAGHRAPLTMCDPWMTCFPFPSSFFPFSPFPSQTFLHAPFSSKQRRCTLQHNQKVCCEVWLQSSMQQVQVSK